VIQHIIDVDATEDEEFLADIIANIKPYHDWVIGRIDPRSPAIEFNFYPAYEVADYREALDIPVVVQDGFIIDGSHRASAAFHAGETVLAYIRQGDLERVRKYPRR
jgi:hypothetical protein